MCPGQDPLAPVKDRLTLLGSDSVAAGWRAPSATPPAGMCVPLGSGAIGHKVTLLPSRLLSASRPRRREQARPELWFSSQVEALAPSLASALIPGDFVPFL